MCYKQEAQPIWQQRKASLAGELTRSSSARQWSWPVGLVSSDTQVARDLGVSPYSVGRWKKLYGPAPAAASAPGVSVAEPERRIRALERANADLREQRTILKKALAIFSEPPR